MSGITNTKRLTIRWVLNSLQSAMVIGLLLGNEQVDAQSLPRPVPLNDTLPAANGSSVLSSGMTLGDMVESGPPVTQLQMPVAIREPVPTTIQEPVAYPAINGSGTVHEASSPHIQGAPCIEGTPCLGSSPCTHGAPSAAACASCASTRSFAHPTMIARPATHCGQCRLPAAQCCCRTNKRQVHHVFLDAPPPSAPSRSEPATANDPSAASIPDGAFVAPPQQGSIVGASRSVGMRGMRITLPQLAFEMPSIELPSILRRSRSPRMEIDADQAAYVVGANEPQAAPAQAAYQMPMYAAPTMAAPAMAAYAMQSRPSAPSVSNPAPSQSAPATSESEAACTLQRSEEEFMALEKRCGRLETLLQQMIQERQSLPSHVFAPPACQEQAPPCPPHSAPTYQAHPQSSCD